MISISYGSFLYSDIPWIIIFDADVCLFRSKMFSYTYLVVQYQMAALVLSTLSLVILYKLTVVAC